MTSGSGPRLDSLLSLVIDVSARVEVEEALRQQDESDLAVEPGVGPVIADPDRLQQIAWNLLSNAIKFTPRGGRVAARIARHDGSLVITVSDDGEGIPRDFLPHVFERFTQADASAKRPHGGLGLGLAIVRHLVDMHGGTVAADSPGPGRGATFTVTLPSPPLPDGAAPEGPPAP